MKIFEMQKKKNDIMIALDLKRPGVSRKCRSQGSDGVTPNDGATGINTGA